MWHQVASYKPKNDRNDQKFTKNLPKMIAENFEKQNLDKKQWLGWTSHQMLQKEYSVGDETRLTFGQEGI